MTAIAYDTEFLEDDSTIELISIGMVDEDGREYYAVNSDMPMERIREREWLMNNVVPHLPTVNPVTPGDRKNRLIVDVDRRSPLVKPKWVIRNEVLAFLSGAQGAADDDLELWAWFGAYDHVAYAQLFGRMIDLPPGLPMFTHELVQLWEDAGKPEKPAKPTDQHNALADARWDMELLTICRKARA